MAITGPIYWNGTTFPSQSGDPVAITYTEFSECCCPCVACSGEQLSATVLVDVGCSGDCEAAGVYTYTSFAVDGFIGCTWLWEKGDWDMTLTYVNSTGLWSFALSDGLDDFTSANQAITCVDGTVTGTASADDAGEFCFGCEATAIFG